MKKPAKKLLKFYWNLSIRHKLLLILYVQIFIPLLLLGYLSYRNSEEIINKRSIDYSQDILQMIEMRLEDYVHNLTVISQNLIYDKEIYNILNSDSKNEDPLRIYEYKNEISNTLKKIINSRNEIQSICLVSNNKNYYYVDNNSEDISIINVLPYYKILEKAREGNGRVIWYLDSEGIEVDNVFLARTVYNRDSFKEIGLLIILVKKEFLETVYQGLTESMQNIAIISEDNRQIVSRNSYDPYLFNLNFSGNHYNKAYKQVKIDHKANTLISYVSLKEPDWKVVAYASLDELYKDAHTLRRRIIYLSLASVFILSILSMFIAVDFVNPINRLVKAMKKVQKGDEGVYIDEDRDDELGFLYKTFNEMSSEIHHLVRWVYREQITRKEAEIKALQSQINPHFLFNTLESINWMAQLNNVPEISETVSELSSLMEASIGRGDRLITVEQEFAYADKYISLLKRRFEDRIELRKDVQEEALKVRIPRLLIQPLIENAVYHGVEGSRNKGIINLKAYTRNDVLVIEVLDNGIGMSKPDLAKLNERLSMDNDTYFKTLANKKNKSIGIENVNRRIKLFYGEEYGLKIESEKGKYTKVTVTIPLKPKDTGEGFYVQGSDN